MLQLAEVIISIILAIPVFYLVMRYNLHMFQLNGYKNNEQRSWIKKNLRKQLMLIFPGLAGVFLMIFPADWLRIVLCIYWLIVIKYYSYLKKNNSKKKLVFTKRVQRLIITDLILNLIVIIPVIYFLGYLYLPAVMGLLIPLQAVLLIPVNVINRPIEKAVNRYFINDAKKKLKQVSGLTVIGVTGSYGKTSVKFYLQALLQGRFHVLVTPESYNTPMGVVKTIRESLQPTHEIFVCEMGARYVGDIKEICEIVHPAHGVITSIGPQHLETFGGMEHIVDTKFELADALPEGGFLFLNGDNEWIVERSKRYHRTEAGNAGTFEEFSKEGKRKDQTAIKGDRKVIFYRNQVSGEGYQAGNLHLSQLGTEFDVTAPDGETETFQTRLVGEHNVINIIGAIAVAHTLGIPLKELKVPVRRLQPIPHRMQMLEQGNVTIIDDAYNSNPVGSKAAVETLALFDGIRILITPGMVELGKEEDLYNYKFGTYAAKCCDYILLVGREHVRPIQKGAVESGFDEKRCLMYDDLKDALAFAYSMKGDGHKYILLENDLPDNY
ncbi:MAG: UDP-N-acetylmuramoyl-tripeptide--D-alanyl-D-alanine ligase [Lachnospiraceae bacterium]|nr:UDP-N-acetylmuramoyl-tripeptide--D-alanyl-D-alanine ligase [Lachnospiraceae bacterium]